MIRKEMVILGLVALLVLVAFGTAVEGISNSEYYEKSEQWCNHHNGTLGNHMVTGKHGGLHCHLPNDRSVHMWAVKKADWSGNVSEAQQEFEDTPGMFETIPGLVAIGLIITLLLAVVQRFRRNKE